MSSAATALPPKRRQREVSNVSGRRKGKTLSHGSESKKKNVALLGKGKGFRRPNIFIYTRADDEFTHHSGVCCVLKVLRRAVKQDHFTCRVSDEHPVLSRCLEQRGEKILSSLITIERTKLMGAATVFIPYHRTVDESAEVRLKVKVDEGTWEYHEPVEDENVSSLVDAKVHLVGVKIVKFNFLELIVTSRPRKVVLQVPTEGLSTTLSKGRKINVSVPNGTFQSDGKIQVMKSSVSREYIKSLSKFHKELDHIMSVDFIINVSCDDVTRKDIVVSTNDKPAEEDFRLPFPYRETLSRCREQFIQQIELENILDSMEDWGILCELQLSDVQTINREFNLRIKFKNAKTDEEKARLLLDELRYCKKEDFRAFLVCLKETDQYELATLLSQTVDNVKEEMEQKEDASSRETTESEEKHSEEHKTIIIQRNGTGNWTMTQHTQENKAQKDIEATLTSGFRDYDVIIASINSEAQLSQKKINLAADLLANSGTETRMCFLCRQHISYPQRIAIYCVKSSKVTESINELIDDGFIIGHDEPLEFGICDGEEMQMTFDPHIGLDIADSDGIFKMQFFSYMENIYIEGRLFVLSTNPELQGSRCDGFLYFSFEGMRGKPAQNAKIKLSLPKNMSYYPRSARSTLEVPVRAISKYVGHRIGTNGTNHERKFTSLLEREDHTYRRILSQTRRICKEHEDRDRCGTFILSWALQRPKRENKVAAIIHALFFDSNLQSDARQFIQAYYGVLSNHYLEEMAKLITDKWQEIGMKLGVSEDELSMLIEDYDDEVERTVKMLEVWRLSDSAIELGANIVEHILKACQDADCSEKVLRTIEHASLFASESVVSELPRPDVN